MYFRQKCIIIQNDENFNNSLHQRCLDMDQNDCAFLQAYSQIQHASQNHQITDDNAEYLMTDLMKNYAAFILRLNQDQFSKTQILANFVYYQNLHRIPTC